MQFDEESARAWMRGAVELARDTRTGEVIATELAERCALAFGVAGSGGPLDEPEHWLHVAAATIAATAAESPADLPELLLVRTRRLGPWRTYWTVSNGETTRTYAPHVTQSVAISRFEQECGKRHARLTIERTHRLPREAAELIEQHFGKRA